LRDCSGALSAPDRIVALSSVMKPFFTLLAFAAASVASHAAPFEIKDGDRVLLLGDALLER
jgi:hypothetical protein